jgi:hypothetical protein
VIGVLCDAASATAAGTSIASATKEGRIRWIRMPMFYREIGP